ncbi:unnamed protein product, partial [Oncorhynchus mykiss]
VLNEDQDKVISNLLENHIQGSEELQLSVDHIKQIICILRDFIHSPERRVMATTISKLKLDLDFDSTSINQIQLVLFGFQDSVRTHTHVHTYSPFGKVFRSLDFFHILLRYSPILKWIKSLFPLINLHTIPHNGKAKSFFLKKIIKYNIYISFQTLYSVLC